MNAIDLEYCARGTPWGKSLLYTGLIALAVVATTYMSLSDELKARDESLADSHSNSSGTAHNRTRSAAGDADGVRLKQEIAQANDVIRRLALPWGELFRSMEGAASDGIALLSITPDPQQQMVTLTGEARTYTDILDYADRLDSTLALTHVRLAAHEVKRDDPQHPVAFVLVAHWKSDK